jgi:hypothetical protein
MHPCPSGPKAERSKPDHHGCRGFSAASFFWPNGGIWHRRADFSLETGGNVEMGIHDGVTFLRLIRSMNDYRNTAGRFRIGNASGKSAPRTPE